MSFELYKRMNNYGFIKEFKFILEVLRKVNLIILGLIKKFILNKIWNLQEKNPRVAKKKNWH